MRIFESFDNLPRFENPVVTVGSFDGVHAAHRELLARVTELARQTGGQSVAVTFHPHPRTVLGNKGEPVELLTTPAEKALLLEGLGVDNLIVTPFTGEFSRLSAGEFVEDYLVGRIGVRHLVVGFNHHFGNGGGSGFVDLQGMGSRHGFSVERFAERDVDGQKVSSTLIRNLIRRGEMAAAGRFLGAPYVVLQPVGAGKLFPPTV
jgi:riboflavin kinase/FMN adenylyltransferase